MILKMYSSKFQLLTSVAHQIEFYEVLGLRTGDIKETLHGIIQKTF